MGPVNQEPLWGIWIYCTCDGNLLECFKQGRNLIRLMFCKVGFGWWVENGPSREREWKQQGQLAMRCVSSMEVKPGYFVPMRFLRPLPLHSAPAVILKGQGCLTGLWWKLQLSAFWKLYLVLVVRDPLIRFNLFLFLVLAILKVTFGKSEIWKCI